MYFIIGLALIAVITATNLKQGNFRATGRNTRRTGRANSDTQNQRGR